MKRLIVAFAVFGFSSSFGIPNTLANGGTKVQSRYLAAQNGKPGRIDSEQYLRIDDPKEAARLLLEESKLAQLDIDEKYQSPARETVFLGIGPTTVDRKDRRMADHASSLVAGGQPETPIICVLKMSRELTIRETADLMAMGVRLYRSIPFYAYIARVTAAQVALIQGVAPLESMVELKPSDKYPASRVFDSEYPITVYSLVGDRPECRNDLKRLGGEVLGSGIDGLYHHEWELYDVRIDPARVKDIADLWWVQMIRQTGAGAGPNSEISAVRDSLTSIATFNARLIPSDSRLLVSANRGKHIGENQKVLIYDTGCDWNHNDLRTKVLAGSSPASSDGDANHGTMVAGIAVGGTNKSVTGGGVSGVAPGASFLFLINDLGAHIPVQNAINNGFWIQNHSWGRYFDQYADSLGAYTDDARLFDTLADQTGTVFIIGAGNQGSSYNYGIASGQPRTITSPATGKNVIAVGSIKYVPDEANQDTLGQVVPSSSRGPTKANILKPELVAPGGSEWSCGEGGVVSCSTALVATCRTWDSGQKYMSWIGTSLATPHVTGAAAVINDAYDEWYRKNHFGEADYAMSDELMKALLINTAIPLKWTGNGPYRHYGVAQGDTVAVLSGCADTNYGYGLVNAYSGSDSPDFEYHRVLCFQGTATPANDPVVQQRVFPLHVPDEFGNYVRPKFLVATLAYDDLPGEHIVDKLSLSIQEAVPGVRTYTYEAPQGLDIGTIQKMVIPRPRGGDWTVKVTWLGTSSSRPNKFQDFAVVVDAMIDAPRLQLSSSYPKNSYDLKTGQSFDLPVRVVNIGRNVAAGVTVFVDDPNHLSTDTNHAFYVGNLLNSGDSATKKIHIVAPSTAGDYPVTVTVDAINKMLSANSLPRVVTLHVREVRNVSGHMTMVPGFNTTVENADVLVDGVPSGIKTGSDGSYSVEVAKGFAGKIKARKGTTVFIPIERDFGSTPVNNDASGKDYQAQYRTVSGRIVDENGVGVADIAVIPKPDVPTMRASNPAPTGSDGRFTCYTEHDWAGTFAPQATQSYVTYTFANSAYAHLDSVVTDIGDLNYSTRRAALWGAGGMGVSASSSGTVATNDVGPECVGDGLGGALITWSDANTDVRAQRISSSGSKLWSGTLERFCTASGEQTSPHAVRLSDGTFLLSWNDKRNGNWDVYAQRLDANGNPMWSQNGIAVCQSTGDQQNVRLVGGSNYAIAVWDDKRGANADIYAQRVNADGTMSWAANGVVVCNASGDQLTPDLALDPSGLAYVAWQDKRPGVSGASDTYMQYLNSQGIAQWATNGIRVSGGGSDDESGQQLAPAGDGACLFCYEVTFLDPSGHTAEGNYLGKITSSGQLSWSKSNSKYSGTPTCMIGDGSGGAFALGARYDYSNPLGWVAHYGSNGNEEWRKTLDGRRVERGSLARTAGGGITAVWQVFEELNPSSTDILAQKYDQEGCPLWGGGLMVASIANTSERRPYIVDDQVSGSIVCWNSYPSIYASHINEYAPSVFSVSGIVSDDTGAPIAGVEVQAENQGDVLTSKETKTDGSYILSIPAFWRGEIHARPRGVLNAVSPSVVAFGPALASTQSNFTISHQSTHWQKDGLLVTNDNLFGGFNASKVSIGGSSAGSLVAWDTGAQDTYVQLLNPSGDIRWTQNGDPLQSTPERVERNPKAVATSGSNFILVWCEDSGVYAQLLDPTMRSLWNERGVLVVPMNADVVEACSDLSDGAFIYAYNSASQKTYVQHLTSSGTNAWTQPAYIFGLPASSAVSPVLCPDGGGGVLASWLSASASYLYVQRVNASGNTMWGGANSWEPLTVRANAFISPGGLDMPGGFDMVGDGNGGAFVSWSERSQVDSIDERIRVSWIYAGGQRMTGNGAEFTTLPGRQWIADMAGPVQLDSGPSFYLLYDELTQGLVQRLVLQDIAPGIDGTVGPAWHWPQQGVTIAPPGPRQIGDAKIVKEPDRKGAIIVWREAPANIAAQAVDSLGTAIWLTRNYQVTDNVDLSRPMSVVSDKSHGAYLAWSGAYGGLYTSRINESEVIQGGATVATFVRRKGNGVVEPISTARAICCPKGEEDALIFDVQLSGQAMTALPANAFTVTWPTTSGNFALRAFRPAVADSAMRLDGDRYRTTITVREIGGCGTDSVTILANGLPIAKAPYDVISPDVETGASPGVVGASDLSKFAYHYVYASHPSAPYSNLVDYVSPPPVGSSRPDSHVELPDLSYFVSHWGHQKASGLLVAGEKIAQSTGQVALNFSESQVDGNRTLRVGVSLVGVERFTVAFFALRNENPLFEFSDWHQNPSYPYITVSAPAVRDGERLVGVGAVADKNAPAWNGELGSIDLRVSSTAPLELTDDDFALITGEVLTMTGDVLSVSMRDRKSSPKFGNSLSQNYPNPFNPTTTINYSIASAGHVDLTVFDVRGAVVRRLVNGDRRANAYHVVWDGTDNKGTNVASGIYFYRLRAPKFSMSKKMLLLK